MSDDTRVSVSHDPSTGVYRGTFDSETVRPSVAVVETVAAALGADPTELDPLYESIDPGALDRICSRESPGGSDAHPTVEFTYHGHRVTVEGLGIVEVRPLDG